MASRILTLAEPDSRLFYSVCSVCGLVSAPFAEEGLALLAGERHHCHAQDSAAGTVESAS